MDSSATSTSSERPQKRQRARKACLPCRKRKRKCDGNFPCSMCTTYGYSCQYPKDDGPSASFVDRGHSHVEDEPELESDARFTASIKRQPEEEGDGSRSPVDTIDRGILDPVKARYMGSHSAVAFPRSLGLDLQSANPPNLHSFAWNCGIRGEEIASSHSCLKDLISREEFDRFSGVYFETVQPIFGVLDQEQFEKHTGKYWGPESQVTDFDAVICGVVALGSFFSASLGHAREAEIAQHAKWILEDPVFSRKPTIDQVSAWVLRTAYLRATTRPHVAWLTSCITIHLAEATGLHHEMDAVVLTTDNISKTIGRSHAGCEVARKLFWSAWSINRLISYEYGRSSVVLSGITTKQVKHTENDFSGAHIGLAQLIPPDTSLGTPACKADLYKALAELDHVPDSHPFLCLTKADLCLCFYRRLRLLKPGMEKKWILKIIEIGNTALVAALQLAQEQHFWWQVLCTVFQYVCVLLAIDNHDSLKNVAGAMETLDRIAEMLNTHVAREANNTAKVLVRDSVRKKRAEVELLERADGGVVGGGNELAGLEVGDIDWDALLDPSFGSNFVPQGGFASLF